MQPKKHYFAHIPTIAIFIVFAMSAPLGVLLFILKSIDKNAEKEEKAAAQAQADYRSDLGPASAQMAPRQEQDPEAACGTDRPTAEQKSAQNWHKTIAVICTILGAVFLFTGAEELIDCLFDFPDFDDLLPALATTIGGAGALWTGLRTSELVALDFDSPAPLSAPFTRFNDALGFKRAAAGGSWPLPRFRSVTQVAREDSADTVTINVTY